MRVYMGRSLEIKEDEMRQKKRTSYTVTFTVFHGVVIDYSVTFTLFHGSFTARCFMKKTE